MSSEVMCHVAQTPEACPNSGHSDGHQDLVQREKQGHQDMNIPSERYAWSVLEWARAVSLSRAYVYVLMDEKRIRSVKCGSRRLITTAPTEFLKQLAEASAS